MIAPLGPISPATRARTPAASTSDRRGIAAAGTDTPADQGPVAGRFDLGPQEDRRGLIQLGDSRFEVMEAQSHAVAAERVGQQDPRTGLEIAALDSPAAL